MVCPDGWLCDPDRSTSYLVCACLTQARVVVTRGRVHKASCKPHARAGTEVARTTRARHTRGTQERREGAAPVDALPGSQELLVQVQVVNVGDDDVVTRGYHVEEGGACVRNNQA